MEGLEVTPHRIKEKKQQNPNSGSLKTATKAA
jgi:hypothetical protein